jgi:PAS domain S-box-containing protein
LASTAKLCIESSPKSKARYSPKDDNVLAESAGIEPMQVPIEVAPRRARWMLLLLTIGIFVVDLLTPVGIAVSVLYIIPLLLTFLSKRQRDPLYFCLVATVLLWADLAWKPEGLLFQYSVTNRALGMFVLWLVASGLVKLKRMQLDLLNAEDTKTKAVQDLLSERIERSHAEGLMEAAQEARAHAETAVMGAVAGRQRAEEQSMLSKLRLQGIIDSAMDAIITVNHDQKVVVFNDAAERMFQCSSDDAIGQPLSKFIPARFREAHHHDVQAFGQSGVTSRRMGQLGTVMGLRADGDEFPLEAAISHITVQGNQLFTAILRDVSERTRLEEQLRRTERVAELGTLASGMAHEIGTPMNVILGRAEYLLDRVSDEPVKKGLQTIVAQVERITRVMNQLLTFARRKPPQPVPVAMQEVVENSLDMFRDRLSNHGVQVVTQMDPDCPRVVADSDQMNQVLINLIMNSLHAMPEGGTLRLELGCERDMVKLTVSDTGHGIRKEVINNIFDPFFTTKEFGKGTGLGLTVVKGIVEEHRGSIAVESEEGKGTTFTIHLPISD